jgi:hypothetical protein
MCRKLLRPRRWTPWGARIHRLYTEPRARRNPKDRPPFNLSNSPHTSSSFICHLASLLPLEFTSYLHLFHTPSGILLTSPIHLIHPPVSSAIWHPFNLSNSLIHPPVASAIRHPFNLFYSPHTSTCFIRHLASF